MQTEDFMLRRALHKLALVVGCESCPLRNCPSGRREDCNAPLIQWALNEAKNDPVKEVAWADEVRTNPQMSRPTPR